jgi:hypothetical protein
MKANDVTNLISALTREKDNRIKLSTVHMLTLTNVQTVRKELQSTLFGMWAGAGVLVGMNSNIREK